MEREYAERKRASIVLAKADIFGPLNALRVGGLPDGREQRYNQQFHPSIARWQSKMPWSHLYDRSSSNCALVALEVPGHAVMHLPWTWATNFYWAHIWLLVGHHTNGYLGEETPLRRWHNAWWRLCFLRSRSSRRSCYLLRQQWGYPSY